ncbi:MAG: Mur ligase family protein [Actinobacteria bacterium]|nr:Mur ligase family protein [Actinomycetota bacterium]
MWQKTKNYYHLMVSIITNIATGFPSRGITVIGVTGTDGKTTTSSLIYHILQTAGMNPSLISSVGAFIGEKKYDIGFHVTTPTPSNLPRIIKKAKNENSKYLVLEITSHALDQYRAWGISFAIGVVTNVTQEHLDYHKSYLNYVKAKAKLLKSAKKRIINRDDDSYQIFKEMKFSDVITYGIKNKADFTLDKINFEIKIPGDFNKYNALAAIAVCKNLGLTDEQIKTGIDTFELPIGRMEEIYKGNFRIMIDFAHTPNSFDKILSSVKSDLKGRLIHVFGSAGKRDFTKRPLMGKASSKYADIIILTAEDPRGEPIEKINKDIEYGISSNFRYIDFTDYKDSANNDKIYFKIDDRKEAIKFAINIAKRGDLVICTGKSHEKSMNYGKGEESWDEFAAAREAIKEKLQT